MNRQRIGHYSVAAARLRHLLCGGMRQTVGAADNECLEAQARTKRRSSESLMSRGDRGIITYFRARTLRFPNCRGLLRLLRLRQQSAQHTRTHSDLDPQDGGKLGLQARHETFCIMRLYPALQEASGDGKLDCVRFDGLKV